MIIMAFDSTAKSASVAVLDGERVLANYSIDNGLTQSELLLPMAEDALKSLKLSFSDVELYACSSGPGSFTGVRIGVSLIKGLAFGKGVPCVGVSTLLALAENLAGLRGVIVPVMDARREQVYTAIFNSDGKTLTRECEDKAISISDLARELESKEEPIYLVGDGYAVVKRAFEKLGLKTENTPELLLLENAASVGKAALRAYLNGDGGSDLTVSPTYLRMPQAERERLEREKTN